LEVVVVVVLDVLLSRYVCSILGCCCSFGSFVFAFCLFDVWFCETIGEIEKSAKSQTTFWHDRDSPVLPKRIHLQVEKLINYAIAF